MTITAVPAALRPLHVIHVVRQYKPAIGGMEAVVEALARIQAARGLKVTVVTLDKVFGGDGAALAPVEDDNGVTIRRAPYKGSQRYPIAPGVLKWMKDADIIHVHGIDFLFDFLALTQFIHRIPMVVSTHGGFFHTKFASRAKIVFFNTVTRLSLSRYGFVAASGEDDDAVFRTLRKRGIAAVENGVDVEKFAGVADPSAKTMIYFGRLADNKRVELLLPFLAALRARDPAWRLIIAGRPMGGEIAAVRKLAETSGLAEIVEVFDTPSADELRTLIGRCSVYVCASEYEGFGLAAVEAISAGLFPALNAIAPFRRTLDRTGVGALVEFDHPEKAAATFLDAWTDWQKTPDKKAAANASVSQFAWAAMESRLAQIYSAMLGKGTRAVLGLPVQVVDADEAIKAFDWAVGEKNPLKVAFCNANLMNIASRDAALRASMQGFYLLTDGIGMDIASRMLFGAKFPENLAGTDFLPKFLDTSRHDLKIFMLGARPESLAQAVAAVRRKWPRHTVVGSHHGYYDVAENASILRTIEEARPDVVLVATANPNQECWIAQHVDQLGVVGIGVGALFDFWAGAVPRAPEWLRKIRFEWLYRLGLEPGRMWKRYLIGNFTFMARITGQWLGGSRAEVYERRRR